MDNTKIEWTEATWNPLRGCSRISEGCRNCYAERMAARFNQPPSLEREKRGHYQAAPYHGLATMTKDGPRWTGRVRLVPEKLDDPLRWKRPRRIFVNSMSDLFHENVSDSVIWQIFNVMRRAHSHTFQVLTKRPERMVEWFKFIERTVQSIDWPLRNVWIGVSVEDQKTADERIPTLLQTPAAVRWISAEPLLEPIEIGPYLDGAWANEDAYPSGPHLDWVVVGGESGPGARMFQMSWARSLVTECKATGVPIFVKQMGSNVWANRLRDKKGGDMAEWPEHLRVREFPRATATAL